MSVATPGILRWLALGDSYTIGEGVPEAERWTSQLARRLRHVHVPVDDPHVIATTGWTTDELWQAVDAEQPAQAWDFVTLLIGVNNLYRGHALAEYQRDYAMLLAHAVAFARGRADRVLALSFPDWGQTPFGAQSGRDLAQVSRETDAWNAAASALCAERDIAWLDITAATRATGTDADNVVADALHPAPGIHAMWAEIALPVARMALMGP